MSLVLLLSLACVSTPQTVPPDTVVVCPEEFRPALAPWLEHRRAQGHQVAVVSNLGTADDVRERIRDVAAGGALRFVVLVGDADPQMHDDPAVRSRSVPTHLSEAQVIVDFGPERDIASDHWYADLNDDGLPDVAIGRLTADTADELSVIVSKVLDYESQAAAAWQRRVNFVAGMGGFGQLADTVMEMSAKRFISEGIPAAYDVTMTYGSWRSPYCPDPRLFHQTTLERLNEGSLFWVYIGHGQRRSVDRVRVPGGQYHILGIDDVPKLSSEQGPPIAFFLACYTCAFDGPHDSLAEEMLRKPGAPVAVVGGTRVTMPYAMTVMAVELLKECFTHRRETLGEVLLHAKRSMVTNSRRDDMSRSLDSMARSLNPRSQDLAAEREEHLRLFNLIGDPLLRLPHCDEVAVDTERSPEAGTTIELVGTSPIDGDCTIELVVRRDRLTFRPPMRTRYNDADEVLQSFQAVYERAIDTRLETFETVVRDGQLRAELRVPDDARGACHVRVMVQGDDRIALGSVDLDIQRPQARAAAD